MRLLLLCMAAVLGTQSASTAPVETPHLAITVVPVASAAAAGARLDLVLEVAPKPRMHVYSPQQKDYIPIALTLQPAAAFSIQPAVYPKPEKYVFAPLKETQLVYSKPFRITQPVTIARAPRGRSPPRRAPHHQREAPLPGMRRRDLLHAEGGAGVLAHHAGRREHEGRLSARYSRIFACSCFPPASSWVFSMAWARII
jgi:hypothetical protein